MLVLLHIDLHGDISFWPTDRELYKIGCLKLGLHILDLRPPLCNFDDVVAHPLSMAHPLAL